MRTTFDQREAWRHRGTPIFHAQQVIDDLEDLIAAVKKHRAELPDASARPNGTIDAELWSHVADPRPETIEERLAAVENKVKALEEK